MAWAEFPLLPGFPFDVERAALIEEFLRSIGVTPANADQYRQIVKPGDFWAGRAMLNGVFRVRAPDGHIHQLRISD